MLLIVIKKQIYFSHNSNLYRSRPSASLTWKINDIEVNPVEDASGRTYAFIEGRKKYVAGRNKDSSRIRQRLGQRLDAKLKEYPPTLEQGNLETSKLGLSFK